MDSKSFLFLLVVGVGGFLAYKTWFAQPNTGATSQGALPGGAAGAAAAPAKPGPGEKNCFACNATGQIACRARCQKGEVVCPGPCLKLSQGSWERQNVAGHNPNELWRKFPTRNGGFVSWNQGHVGEVVTIQNGEPVNIGKCTVCSGTTKVKCAVCSGTGYLNCTVCDGKKFIPEAWTESDNPKLKKPPTVVADLKTIRLKDGSTIQGKISGRMSDTVWITTGDGKLIKVNADDIVPDSK